MRRAERAAKAAYDRSSDRFTAVNARLAAQSPENRLNVIGGKLDGIDSRLETAFTRLLDRRSSELGEKIARLEALSPLKVLARGYSIASREDGRLVRSRAEVSPGDRLLLRVADGSIPCAVLEPEGKDDTDGRK